MTIGSRLRRSLASLCLFAAVLARCNGESKSADPREGRQLYLSYGCAACHGREGHGDGPSGAGGVARPRDFRRAETFGGGHTVDAVAATIANGVANGTTGMAAYPQIPREERTAIAAWIVSLGSSAATPSNTTEVTHEENR